MYQLEYVLITVSPKVCGSQGIYLFIYFWIEDKKAWAKQTVGGVCECRKNTMMLMYHRGQVCLFPVTDPGGTPQESRTDVHSVLKICFPLTSTDCTVAHKSFFAILLCSPPCCGWNKGCLCALPKLSGRWENCGPLRSFCPVVFTFQNGRLSITKPNIWHKRTWIVGGLVISSLSAFFSLIACRLCGRSEWERGLKDIYKINFRARKDK